MNAFEIEAPRRRQPNDRDAGLRENILKLVSDPESGVVAFPARRKTKLRNRKVTPAEAALVPGPHDAMTSNGVRLVVSKRRAGPSLVMALGRTILGAIAVGTVVGGAIAHDRVEAYGETVLAGLMPAVTEQPVEAPAPSMQTAMLTAAALMDFTYR